MTGNKNTAEIETGDNLMFNYEERVKSFGDTGKWFESGPSVRNNMAKWGFYVPDEDHRKRKAVKCAYCHKTFLDWTRNDEPEDRHTDESPDCKLMTLGKNESDITVKELLQLHLQSEKLKLKEKFEGDKNKYLQELNESRLEIFPAK